MDLIVRGVCQSIVLMLLVADYRQHEIARYNPRLDLVSVAAPSAPVY